ncbi:MAG: GTPase Era [Coriobacteriia bacterium]|nr:GTPase Era [Coriobacteriia bacterium]MBN2822681.1 GTPase Era [Coriobacteriia bacterium]
MGSSSYAEVLSGFVALVGRPNAGKSTLTNALVGAKVAITSDTPQTTRHRLRAVLDLDDAQIVIVDTPGMHKPQDALGEELNRSSLLALSDVDVACLVIDASVKVGKGDKWVAHRVLESSAKKVLVLTKADLVSQEDMVERLQFARSLGTFDDEVVLSAVDGFNLGGFVETVKRYLPMGPRYFPRDMPTDQPLGVMLAEFIREKVLRNTRDEVPHAIGVEIEDLAVSPDGEHTNVQAYIYVERESQKGIIIGKGGEMIRKIGTEARGDLERLLGTKVYLDLRVKVKKDWRRDASQIRRFGYGEGL